MENNKRYDIIGWDVDTQRGFMETKLTTGYQGQLAVLNENFEPVGAMELAENLTKLTSYLRKGKIPIFGSVDWHNQDSKEFSDTPDFKNTFPIHCVRNTYDAQKIDATQPENPLFVDWDTYQNQNDLIDSIRKHTGEVIFRKDNFNVFETQENPGIGNPYAMKVIRNLSPSKALVYGVATDVCNDFAIKGLKELGVEIYAIIDCMKGVTPKGHEETLKKWKEENINLITLDYVLNGGIK